MRTVKGVVFMGSHGVYWGLENRVEEHNVSVSLNLMIDERYLESTLRRLSLS
jgi:hypothetical protein